MSTGELKGQLVRYAVSGGILMLLYSSVYWVLAVPFATPALFANTVAFLLNLAAGWVIHSRWSFRGYSLPNQRRVAVFRFFFINVAGYALNSFWVWLIVERLGGSVPLSIVPIALITPWFSFWLTRQWIFVPPTP